MLKKIKDENNCEDISVENRIHRLLKKGVLTFSKEMKTGKLSFYGEKGYYYPKEVAVELTNICNFRCPFCYKNASSQGQYITDDTIYELVNVIKNKVKNILLTGGEPTIHPHYMEYILTFTEFANVRMITNGSVLYQHDPRILSRLSNIQFSLYGCDNEEYKRATGSADGFSDLCKSIEFVKNNNINLNAALTISDYTLDHVEDFIKVVVFFGIKVLRIGFADYFGRGAYLFSQNNDYTEKIEPVYSQILLLKQKYQNIINLEIANVNSEHINNRNDIYDNVYKGSLCCGCGSEYIVISQSGEIRPCQMLPESFFSFKGHNTLKEHISGDFHVNELRKATERYYSYHNFKEKGFYPCHALEQHMCGVKL